MFSIEELKKRWIEVVFAIIMLALVFVTTGWFSAITHNYLEVNEENFEIFYALVKGSLAWSFVLALVVIIRARKRKSI